MIRSLLTLQSERRSGVLTILADDSRVAIFLSAGVVVYASEAPAAVSLGQRLIQQRVLTTETHARIVARLATLSPPPLDDHVAFCEAAVALGVLQATVAWSSLKAFVRRTLLRTFQRTEVTWTFEDTPAAAAKGTTQLDYVGRFKLDVEPLVAQAMRGMDPGALASDLERLLDVDVILALPPAEIATKFDLSMAEMNLLLALETAKTPRAVMATREAAAVDALAVLVALATTHVLRRAVGSPTSSRSFPAVSQPTTSPSSFRAGPVGGAGGSPRSFPAVTVSQPPSSGGNQRSAAPPSSGRSMPAAPISTRSMPVGAVVASPPSSRPVIISNPPSSSRSMQAAAPATMTTSTRSSLPPHSDVRRTTDPNVPAARTRESVDRPRTRDSVDSGPGRSITPRARDSIDGGSTPPRSSRDSVDRRSLTPRAFESVDGRSMPPRTRSDPNRMTPEAKELGERWMMAGVEHARAARWARAASDLAQALEYLPHLEALRLYALWSTIQARASEPATKAERAELARAALSTTKNDPEFAFGYYVAGDLSLLDNDVEQAFKLLSRAVKLDPGLLDATRLLRVVERRRNEQAPPASKGLFRKLW